MSDLAKLMLLNSKRYRSKKKKTQETLSAGILIFNPKKDKR